MSLILALLIGFANSGTGAHVFTEYHNFHGYNHVRHYPGNVTFIVTDNDEYECSIVIDSTRNIARFERPGQVDCP